MTGMIRKAHAADLAELSSLWDQGFPGEHEFGLFVFEQFFDPENILVCELDGALAAMLLALPRKIAARDWIFPVSYVMGVTTRQDLRGKGVMSELMKSAHEALTARGDALSVLIPANAGLFDYYARFDYLPYFRIEKKTVERVPPVDGYDADFASSDFEAFDLIYTAALTGSPRVARGKADWDCLFEEFRRFGGNAILLSKGGKPVSYAFFGEAEGKLTVNEALGLDDASENAALAVSFGTSSLNEALLLSPVKAGGGIPFGCALPLNKAGEKLLRQDPGAFSPYINLIHN
jgi:predicted acetyltransferase